MIGLGGFERSPSVREKLARVRPEWDLTLGSETALLFCCCHLLPCLVWENAAEPPIGSDLTC